MRRVPILPTLVVALAIAAMVSLGLWQLRRAAWKEALLGRYAANAHLPALTLPVRGDPATLLYRPARATCRAPLTWTARAGQNRAGDGGWRHVALCAGGLAIDMGWSRDSRTPQGYEGGTVAGVIDADRDHGLLLVARDAAPGLQPSRAPTPADLPNNHLAYAGQWFLFAGVAALIYGLALRRRWRQKLAVGRTPG